MCKLIGDLYDGSPLMAEVRAFAYKSDSLFRPDAHKVAEKACQSISKLVDSGPFVEQGLRFPRRRLASPSTTRTLSKSLLQQGIFQL